MIFIEKRITNDCRFTLGQDKNRGAKQSEQFILSLIAQILQIFPNDGEGIAHLSYMLKWIIIFYNCISIFPIFENKNFLFANMRFLSIDGKVLRIKEL